MSGHYSHVEVQAISSAKCELVQMTRQYQKGSWKRKEKGLNAEKLRLQTNVVPPSPMHLFF